MNFFNYKKRTMLRDFATFVAAHVGTFWIVRGATYLVGYHNVNVIHNISIFGLLFCGFLNSAAASVYIKFMGGIVIYAMLRAMLMVFIHCTMFKLGYPEIYANVAAFCALLISF